MMCCTDTCSLLCLYFPHTRTCIDAVYLLVCTLTMQYTCSETHKCSQARRRGTHTHTHTHTERGGNSCQAPDLPPEWSPRPLGLVCLLSALWLLCLTAVFTHTHPHITVAHTHTHTHTHCCEFQPYLTAKKCAPLQYHSQLNFIIVPLFHFHGLAAKLIMYLFITRTLNIPLLRGIAEFK